MSETYTPTLDPDFLAAVQGVIGIWIETGREGVPNVNVPMNKLEGFLYHMADLQIQLDATKVVADAALVQMRENADRMDKAEGKLESLTDG